MAGSDSGDLQDETRDALLSAIKEKASKANTAQIEQLALAFALTVGASKGRLPGTTQVTAQ